VPAPSTNNLKPVYHGEHGIRTAWLYDLLKPHVTEVVVCNPRKNALLKEASKGDQIDARKLAELLRLTQVPSLNVTRKSTLSPRINWRIMLAFVSMTHSITNFPAEFITAIEMLSLCTSIRECDFRQSGDDTLHERAQCPDY
jgi:hypothetical protein